MNLAELLDQVYGRVDVKELIALKADLWDPTRGHARLALHVLGCGYEETMRIIDLYIKGEFSDE